MRTDDSRGPELVGGSDRLKVKPGYSANLWRRGIFEGRESLGPESEDKNEVYICFQDG